MSKQEQVALAMLSERETVSAAELRAAGVPGIAMMRLVDSGQVERLARGLYGAAHVVGEDAALAAACDRFGPGAVVVLTTAARLHGFHDENLHELHVAISGRHVPKRTTIGGYDVKVSLWEDKLTAEAGVEEREVFGRLVRVTNPARTIADLYKFRRALGVSEAEVFDWIRRGAETHAISFDDVASYAHAARARLDGLDAVLVPASPTCRF